MAHALSEYFENQGLQLVEESLQRIVGQRTADVKDDASYRLRVVMPALNALPLGIRLLLKRRAGAWNQLYASLRAEVLDLGGKSVTLRSNPSQRIARVVRGALGTAPVTIVGLTSVHHATPVAMPVTPMTEVRPSAGAAIVVGIDLGTSYSVVAYIDAHGRPQSLLNQDGERLTPSVVQFGDDQAVVGKEALARSAFEPERTAIGVKRDMGAKFYRNPINGEYLPPEMISAFILRNLKDDAARQLGPVRGAVITVPAYFDETRRRATMDAGRLAGLEVIDIINEPTAAAIAYGHQMGYLGGGTQHEGDRPLRVLVFDLGGGTFDVTIVEISAGAFRALATDGDVNLGGRDWDEKLVEIAAERLRAQVGEDLRENPISAHELWTVAEAAKRTLSERPQAAMKLYHGGRRVALNLTRTEFEEATAPLLERTRLTTKIVVRQAGLTFDDLDRVLLVGGSTRMPMVVRMIEELTGKSADRSVSADEAVAHGAALYARLLAAPSAADEAAAPDDSAFTVSNVNSHSLGVLGTDPDTGAKLNKIVIPKNSALPCTVRMPFKTFRHGQHSVLIKVLEGESEKPVLCTEVGVCSISSLPPDLPAGWPIEVGFTYQNNGRLHVTAKLKGYEKLFATDFIYENRQPDEELGTLAAYVEEELSASS